MEKKSSNRNYSARVNQGIMIKQLPILIAVLFGYGLNNLSGQSDSSITFPNGAKVAIALTYDDGLGSHISQAGPALNKYNIKGTFYLTSSSPSVYDEMDKWKNLATSGHELGNHTVYHPCQKSIIPEDWIKSYYDLDRYKLDQIENEIKVANTLLKALDGKNSRTFAYPCAHYEAGGEEYIQIVSEQFIAARGVTGREVAVLKDSDMLNVQSWAPDGHSGEELIAYVEEIIKKETFSTITFHGIGGDYIKVSTEAHEKLLQYLEAHKFKIWDAPFKGITEYIKSKK